MKVSKESNCVLCSMPLGACLGVMVYDPISRIGGLLHGLLPAARFNPAKAMERPAMFLDSGLSMMMQKLKDSGAHLDSLQISVVGGSEILEDSNSFNIGKRNFDFLNSHLAAMGLSVHGQDVGGHKNKSVMFHLANGEIFIKHTGTEEVVALCRK